MKTTAIAVMSGFLCLLPLAASAQTQAASTTAANPLSQPDKDFVQAASMASSTEIDASKLAMSNSSDSDVKSFAHDNPDSNVALSEQYATALLCLRDFCSDTRAVGAREERN